MTLVPLNIQLSIGMVVWIVGLNMLSSNNAWIDSWLRTGVFRIVLAVKRLTKMSVL